MAITRFIDSSCKRFEKHHAVGQHPVEMLRAGLRDGQSPNAVKVFIFDGHVPSPPCLILFLLGDVLHDFLPRPHSQLGVGAV